MVSDDELYRLRLGEDRMHELLDQVIRPPQVSDFVASTPTREELAATIRAAIERVRTGTGYDYTPDPISPAAHDAINDLLDRPHGTPVTRSDHARAVQVLYDRCTPEERERLLAASLQSSGW